MDAKWHAASPHLLPSSQPIPHPASAFMEEAADKGWCKGTLSQPVARVSVVCVWPGVAGFISIAHDGFCFACGVCAAVFMTASKFHIHPRLHRL